MTIAVPYENGMVFQHFGRTEQFKVYNTENGQVAASQIVSTNGSGHSALAGILSSLAVDTLICGGIGFGAQNALAETGIKLYGGVNGEADTAVDSFLAGRLVYNPDIQCDHHEHAHGSCGEHGCGGHSGSCHHE